MEEDDVYVLKLPTGASGGYHICRVQAKYWDEIYSFYDGEEFMYDFEDDDGEVIPTDLSRVCACADIVVVNPADDVEEFIEQIEETHFFSILCNVGPNTTKYRNELDYMICPELDKIEICDKIVESIGLGRNRISSTLGNRKLYIYLSKDDTSEPIDNPEANDDPEKIDSTEKKFRKKMVIELIDTKHHEKTITKTIIGEDIDYKEMLSFLESMQEVLIVSDVASEDSGDEAKPNDNNIVINKSPTVASLADGVVKSQSDMITQRLLARMNPK